MNNGEEDSNDQEEKVMCEENEFTHEEDNLYTQRKNLGRTSSLFSSVVASQQSSEITVKTDDETYQHPILRKQGLNGTLLRDQFFSAGMKCRYIVSYNRIEME